MAGVNFLGSYSGIDQSTIDQMMAVEKRPLIQMSEKKTNIEAEKNAWNDIRTRLNSLSDKIKVLQNSDTYSAKTASKGEGSSLTVSKNTNSGSYTIRVNQMSTKTSTIGGVIAAADGDSSKVMGITGKFSINNNSEIEVSVTDTLTTIADKINAGKKESGVEATIIDKRLVLTNLETGKTDIAINNIEGTIVEELGLEVGTGENQAKITEGKNALFTVNGVDVERESNSVNDVIQYTTINLTKEHGVGQSDTLVVTEDSSKIAEALKGFIGQYNSTMTFINDKLSAGTPGTEGSRGALASDGSLMRLQSALRSMVSSSIANGNTDIKNMSQLGITTADKFGQLVFDESKLTERLKEGSDQIKNFFSSTGTGDSNIGFVPKLNSYIDSFSSSTGMIKGKTDGFERTLKEIGKQVETFNARMEKKEKYYIAMFSRLDTAMMQAESQMSWLDSQMSAMNPSSK